LADTLQSFPGFCYGRSTEAKSDHVSCNYFHVAMSCWASPVLAQNVGKAISAHTSESISLALLMYALETASTMKEGVD
jgi:hypothetical protein